MAVQGGDKEVVPYVSCLDSGRVQWSITCGVEGGCLSDAWLECEHIMAFALVHASRRPHCKTGEETQVGLPCGVCVYGGDGSRAEQPLSALPCQVINAMHVRVRVSVHAWYASQPCRKRRKWLPPLVVLWMVASQRRRERAAARGTSARRSGEHSLQTHTQTERHRR